MGNVYIYINSIYMNNVNSASKIRILNNTITIPNIHMNVNGNNSDGSWSHQINMNLEVVASILISKPRISMDLEFIESI